MLFIAFLFALHQLTATAQQCSSTVSFFSDENTLVDYKGGSVPGNVLGSNIRYQCGSSAIWTPNEGEEGTFNFRRKFILPDWAKQSLQTASICIIVDDTFKLFVNGEQMGSGRLLEKVTIDLRNMILRTGKEIELVFVVYNRNGPAWLNYRLDLGLA